MKWLIFIGIGVGGYYLLKRNERNHKLQKIRMKQEQNKRELKEEQNVIGYYQLLP